MSADVNPGTKVDLGNDQQIAFVMNPGSDHITRTDLNGGEDMAVFSLKSCLLFFLQLSKFANLTGFI